MEFIKQNRVVIATVIVMLAIIGVIWLNQQNDTSSKKEADKQSVQQQAEKNKQATDKKTALKKQQQAEKSRDYMYTAAAGDSYTAFARQSVQAYAKANSVALSKAQIIAAETTLTQKAGAPYLEIGDKLTIRHADLQTSVDAAKALSPAQLAAWERYVPYVAF